MKLAILKVQLTLYLLDLGSWILLTTVTHIYHNKITADPKTKQLDGIAINPYQHTLQACIILHGFFTFLQVVVICKTI